MRNIGIIGYGAIGSSIVALWPNLIGDSCKLAALLVRPRQVEIATAETDEQTLVTTDIDSFFSRPLDVVVEAAGHAAIIDYGERVLAEGCALHILSAGALADPALQSRLEAGVRVGRGRIIISSGALAGFDGLLSMRASGLISVKYVSTKPVLAWRDTLADQEGKLTSVTRPKVIFRGSARAAARAYPRNANLAAAVALAGLGFDQTAVELIADPAANMNSARILATSKAGRLDVTVRGSAFGGNPKSSQLTAMSAIASLSRLANPIAFA